jgi:hypothetical protein
MWIVCLHPQVQREGLWEVRFFHQQGCPMCEPGIAALGESGTNQSRNVDSNLASGR